MSDEQPAQVTVTPLLTVPRAAELLGCSTRTVRRRIDAGLLPAVTEGDRAMVRADDLRAYVDGLGRYGSALPRRRQRPSRRHTFEFLSE
jgi:excisionase family DNA binding protein